MENVWYNAPLTAVSTDITRVGGEYAAVGMVRYDEKGNRYQLVKVTTGYSAQLGKVILAWDGGADFSVEPAVENGRCSGVATFVGNIPSGSYVWMQDYGPADNVQSTGTKGAFVGAGAGNVGANLIVNLTLAGATLLAGYVGWGMADNVGGLQRVFIAPGFVTT